MLFRSERLINHKFNFTISTYSRFLQVVNKIDKEFEYSSFDDLNIDNQLSLLYFLISNSNLFYLNKTEFPLSFYKIHIIQKIYTYLNTNLNFDISKNIKVKLLKSIDPNYIFYNIEMNRFLDNNFAMLKQHNSNYQVLIDKKYSKINFESHNNQFSELPFFVIDEINSKDIVEFLISSLRSNKNDQRIDFYIEKTTRAQNNEIIDKICNETTWRKNKDFVFLFLEKLINDRTLKNIYKHSITDCLIYGIHRNIIDDELPNKYIEKSLFRNRLVSFDFQIAKLYENLIEYTKIHILNNNYYTYVLFESTNIKKLSYFNKDFNKNFEEIDYLSFINTDLGRYYTTLMKIDKDVFQTYYQQFITGLNDLNPIYSQYVTGLFFRQINKEGQNIYSDNSIMFHGFSTRYIVGIGSYECAYFENAALSVFNSNTDSEIIVRNTAIILCDRFDATSDKIHKSKVNYKLKKRILTKMIELYLFLEDENKTYVLSWLKWYIENYEFSLNIITSEILKYLVDVDTNKVEILIDHLSRLKQLNSNDKIDEYLLIHIRYLDKYNSSEHKTLFKLLKFLISKSMLVFDSSFVSAIYKIIEAIQEKDLQSVKNMYADFLIDKIPINDYSKLFQS